MKLVLMWLLGVPLLVTSMVFARSLAAEHRVGKTQQVNAQQCSSQEGLHDMTLVVTDQGHYLACQRHAVQ